MHTPAADLIGIAEAGRYIGIHPTSLYTYTKGDRQEGIIWHTKKDGKVMLRRSDVEAIKRARDDRARSGAHLRSRLNLADYGVELFDYAGQPISPSKPAPLNLDTATSADLEAWVDANPGPATDIVREVIARAEPEPEPALPQPELPQPEPSLRTLDSAWAQIDFKRHHLAAQLTAIEARLKPLEDERELIRMEADDVETAAAKLADVERILAGF